MWIHGLFLLIHISESRQGMIDIEIGTQNLQRERMDGGLIKHSRSCTHEINWDETKKIVAQEERWTHRQHLKGIESKNAKSQPRTQGICFASPHSFRRVHQVVHALGTRLEAMISKNMAKYDIQ